MYTIAPAQHEQTTSRGVARYEPHSTRPLHVANEFATTGTKHEQILESWNLEKRRGREATLSPRDPARWHTHSRACTTTPMVPRAGCHTWAAWWGTLPPSHALEQPALAARQSYWKPSRC